LLQHLLLKDSDRNSSSNYKYDFQSFFNQRTCLCAEGQ